MEDTVRMKRIAVIHTDFPEKFGIPRQGGITEMLESRIVFEPPFRNELALRGIEGFSHLWLLWEFSETERDDWSPMVKPPRLGGKTRMGVFATRSPFRPNPIGLTCVRFVRLERTPDEGCVLVVAGADLMDGTPLFDIKPYLPYADSRPGAASGFAGPVSGRRLEVEFPDELLAEFPPEKRAAVLEILRQDPRPGYHHDPERVYGTAFAGRNIRFTVCGDRLTVLGVEAWKGKGAYADQSRREEQETEAERCGSEEKETGA